MAAGQRVSAVTSTTKVALTPLARVVRTAIQTVISFAAVEPTLINVVHVNTGTATEVASITAGAVFVVATAQNLLEHFGILPVVGGKAAS